MSFHSFQKKSAFKNKKAIHHFGFFTIIAMFFCFGLALISPKASAKNNEAKLLTAEQNKALIQKVVSRFQKAQAISFDFEKTVIIPRSKKRHAGVQSGSVQLKRPATYIRTISNSYQKKETKQAEHDSVKASFFFGSIKNLDKMFVVRMSREDPFKHKARGHHVIGLYPKLDLLTVKYLHLVVEPSKLQVVAFYYKDRFGNYSYFDVGSVRFE